MIIEIDIARKHMELFNIKEIRTSIKRGNLFGVFFPAIHLSQIGAKFKDGQLRESRVHVLVAYRSGRNRWVYAPAIQAYQDMLTMKMVIKEMIEAK